MPDGGLVLRMMVGAMQGLGDWLPGPVSSIAERMFTIPRRFARPPREREAYQDAERLFIDTQVGRVRVFRWRQDDMPWSRARPIVLLMHGWQGRGTQLCAFIEPLHARGFDVIALDAPAHGESSGTAADAPLFSLAIREVAAALAPDGLFAVVAHSMGAGASMLAAIDGLQVKRVVLLAPPLSVDTVTADFCTILQLPSRAEAAFYQRLTRRYHPYVWQRVRFGEHARSLAHIPALVIHDEDDTEVPFARGKAVADAWPGSTLMVTHGLGHRRILRDPSVIAAIDGFLTQE
jgi:pimeloyl-ACP methyl ester carboxylesterase